MFSSVLQPVLPLTVSSLPLLLLFVSLQLHLETIKKKKLILYSVKELIPLI
jgi:hypothetical protein